MTEQISANPNVAERTPAAPVALADEGAKLLEEAHSEERGRAALTLTPSAGGPLKQTLLALVGGRELNEHTAPGPATIQILQGRATLVWAQERAELSAGQWARIPPQPHALHADEDLVALLTVVPNPDVAQQG